MRHLKAYAALTDKGPSLSINEDAYDYDLSHGLFMVLDGFGGSGVGERIVSTIKEEVKSFYSRSTSELDATMPYFFSQRYLVEGNALINSLFFTHKNLLKTNAQVGFNEKGGSSGVFVAFSEDIATVVSVGNCSALLFREGHLNKLFVEDSFQTLSALNREQAQSVPLSALGLYPELHIQTKEVSFKDGDKLILMSDGVASQLGEQELLYALTLHSDQVQSRLRQLFQMSNERGNQDNQSAMILEF